MIIRDARQAKNMTQAELSYRLLSVLQRDRDGQLPLALASQNVISLVERLQRTPPNAHWLDALCEVLDITHLKDAIINEYAEAEATRARNQVWEKLKTSPISVNRSNS